MKETHEKGLVVIVPQVPMTLNFYFSVTLEKVGSKTELLIRSLKFIKYLTL
jgi:hypothetical protein